MDNGNKVNIQLAIDTLNKYKKNNNNEYIHEATEYVESCYDTFFDGNLECCIQDYQASNYKNNAVKNTYDDITLELSNNVVCNNNKLIFDGTGTFSVHHTTDNGKPHAVEMEMKIYDIKRNMTILKMGPIDCTYAHNALYAVDGKMYMLNGFSKDTPTTANAYYVGNMPENGEMHLIVNCYGGFVKDIYINSSHLAATYKSGLIEMNYSASEDFYGEISYLKYYNRQLTDIEIKYLLHEVQRIEKAPTLKIGYETNPYGSYIRFDDVELLQCDINTMQTLNVKAINNNDINLKSKNKYYLKDNDKILKGLIEDSHTYDFNIDIKKLDNVKRMFNNYTLVNYKNPFVTSNSVKIVQRVNDSSINENTEFLDVLPEKMYISPREITARVGEIRLLRATFFPAIIKDKDVIWKSSNSNVAEVDGGVITLKKVGSCVITATSNYNNSLVDKAYITVREAIKPSEIYTIDLDKFNLDNTGINNALPGINEALIYAKELGYLRAKLPEGIYSIDTNDGKQSIYMQSNLEFDITGCTLKLVADANPDTLMFITDNADNSKLIGGILIGDRETHDYGMRINEDGESFISGDIDSSTGEWKEDTSRIVTKNFIEYYEDWFTKEHSDLPNQFRITPLWHTEMNTVDGGCAYVWCYDENENFLGMTKQSNGFLSERTLLDGTKKIKISLRGQTRLDAVIAITTRKLHYTYEFGTGVTVRNCNNFEINGTEILSFTGDCVSTVNYGNSSINDFRIIGCKLHDSRRQGISYCGTGENNLVKDTEIYNINGVDPQCGVDFEDYGYCINTLFDNCYFHHNNKWDITACQCVHDIEIRNSTFTGAISGASGYLIDIHDNIFNTVDEDRDCRYHSAGVATIKNNIRVRNNIFNANSTISTTTDAISEFSYNTVEASTAYIRLSNCHDNKFNNSTVWYNGIMAYNEELTKCTISGGDSSKDLGIYPVLRNFKMYDCQMTNSPHIPTTTFIDSYICNSEQSLYIKWGGHTTYDNCIFETKFTSYIPLIDTQAYGITIKNSRLNLALTQLVRLSYQKDVTLTNNEITFNNAYFVPTETLQLCRSAGGKFVFDGNSFVKNFDLPQIILPSQTNAKVNGEVVPDGELTI